MSSDKKAFELNFNLYLGDPDDGVASISSVDVLENFGSHQETLTMKHCHMQKEKHVDGS